MALRAVIFSEALLLASESTGDGERERFCAGLGDAELLLEVVGDAEGFLAEGEADALLA